MYSTLYPINAYREPQIIKKPEDVQLLFKAKKNARFYTAAHLAGTRSERGVYARPLCTIVRIWTEFVRDIQVIIICINVLASMVNIKLLKKYGKNVKIITRNYMDSRRRTPSFICNANYDDAIEMKNSSFEVCVCWYI